MSLVIARGLVLRHSIENRSMINKNDYKKYSATPRHNHHIIKLPSFNRAFLVQGKRFLPSVPGGPFHSRFHLTLPKGRSPSQATQAFLPFHFLFSFSHRSEVSVLPGSALAGSHCNIIIFVESSMGRRLLKCTSDSTEVLGKHCCSYRKLLKVEVY